MTQFTIASFYKFVPLEHYETLKAPLLRVMTENHLLGTVILAQEGINGSVSGKADDLQAFYGHLHALPEFSDLNFKETYADSIPFAKAKVKFRKEIVTMGVEGIDPGTLLGSGEAGVVFFNNGCMRDLSSKW